MPSEMFYMHSDYERVVCHNASTLISFYSLLRAKLRFTAVYSHNCSYSSSKTEVVGTC